MTSNTQRLPAAIDAASLPAAYEAAKAALATAERLVEVAKVKDHAVLLATWARLTKDNKAIATAKRIQLRAARRMGELLSKYDGRGRPRKNAEGGHGNLSQRQAAAEAGISEHQQLQAVRVASLPEDEFERAIEVDDPPSLTVLAGEAIISFAVEHAEPRHRDLIMPHHVSTPATRIIGIAVTKDDRPVVSYAVHAPASLEDAKDVISRLSREDRQRLFGWLQRELAKETAGAAQ